MADWNQINALQSEQNNKVKVFDQSSWDNATKWYNDRLQNIPPDMRSEFFKNVDELIPNWSNMLALKNAGFSEKELQAMRAYARMSRAAENYKPGSMKGNDGAPNSKNLIDWNVYGRDFGGSITGEVSNWRQAHGEILTPDQQRAQDEADAAAASQAGQKDGVTNQLQALYNQLSSPVYDANTGQWKDPIAQQLAQTGANAATNQARMAGVAGDARGGLSTAMAGSGAAAALNPYLQNRQNLATNVLGTINQRDLSLEQLNQNAFGLNMQAQQLQNQQNMGLFGQGANQAGSIGSAIGGGLGAATAAIPYVGPAIAAVAAPLGSAIGGGIGQNIYASQHSSGQAPYSPYKPLGDKGGY